MRNLRIQYISKKALKNILQHLESRHDIDLTFIEMLRKAEEVKVAYSDKFEIVVFNSTPALFKIEGMEIYIPTLYVLNVLYNTERLLIVPTVVVDEGAIEPLKRGADVMVPGIKKLLKSFNKGDIVAVMDPSERYLIVVGFALVDSESIAPGVKGKGIKNVSHLGDNIWTASIQLAKTFSK